MNAFCDLARGQRLLVNLSTELTVRTDDDNHKVQHVPRVT